jgi:sec-independent protein translocase protein TatA
MTSSLVAIPGGWELIVIVLVIIMLFGAKKLPELARGTGQALRIFKSETKGLIDDDDEDTPKPAERQIEAGTTEVEGTVREHRDDTA